MFFLALCIFITIIVFFIIVLLSRRKQGRPTTSLVMPFVFVLLLFGFVLAVAAVTGVSINSVGTNEFFMVQVVPFYYWLGLALVAGATGYLLLFYEKKNPMILVVFALILLVVSMRFIFPGIFVSVTSYEPDSNYYMSVVDSWTKIGINFGAEGMYQHDYPMSFIIAYAFAKLGVPVEEFFRWAPSFVYALDVLLLYFLYKEIFPRTRAENGVLMAIMFFSLSTLKYFMTIHWCPDIVGASFLLLALYSSVRFAKRGVWKVQTILPMLILIFALILSHHLSTLYFTIALLGLAISARLFRVPEIRGGSLSFFVLAICTYTIWFAYGSYFYPSFFRLYVYFGGQVGSPTSQFSGLALLDRLTLIAQPIFVSIFLVWEVLRSFEIKKLSDLIPLLRKPTLKILSLQENERLPMAFAGGFFVLSLIILLGIVIPTIFPDRVLEVFLVGMYPAASLKFTRFCCEGSKKRKILLLTILVFLVFVSTYRYNRGQQMRLIGS